MRYQRDDERCLTVQAPQQAPGYRQINAHLTIMRQKHGFDRLSDDQVILLRPVPQITDVQMKPSVTYSHSEAR
ncbi:unnamed protein product [Notodromas monacha]|uniref:Uncharacterized protein n=1 Tax=Notodromas monacha TaxID=399045 RepID=A0A7R9C0T8_9CRUS|nr:unnamed protein product [Notodromas monacha]CAG0923701.1 unnamed protein product [Notodromas monacha]